MKHIKEIILIAVLLFVLVAGGYYVYNDIVSQAENLEINTTDEGVIIKDNGIATIETIPTEDPTARIIPRPNLDSAFVFNTEMSPEAREIMENKIEKTRTALKNDPTVFGDWLDLGIQYKIVGDYEKTREVWEYAGAIRPQSGLPFRNLGDLYGYYLNEPQKAEENLLKAIEKDPNQEEFYSKTYSFYIEVLKDTDKAQAIVERGLEANPGSENLQNLLNAL